MAMCYVQMYFSYLEPLADLTDEEVGRVVRAILKYGADKTIPDLSPSERMAFTFMKTNFDRRGCGLRCQGREKAGKRKERRRPGGKSERQKTKTT